MLTKSRIAFLHLLIVRRDYHQYYINLAGWNLLGGQKSNTARLGVDLRNKYKEEKWTIVTF
jgi:hypothetical protein